MNTTILAIDPGCSQSAMVELAPSGVVLRHAKLTNLSMLTLLEHANPDFLLVVEWLACYGMPVGAEVLMTGMWAGRFVQAFVGRGGGYDLLYRQDVKQHLCHHIVGVNDAVIRQRCIDIYGGKSKAVGNKKAPGPLYGIKTDEWAALAVAMAYQVGARSQIKVGVDA